MKHVGKKALALFLSVCLVLTLIVPSFAAGTFNGLDIGEISGTLSKLSELTTSLFPFITDPSTGTAASTTWRPAKLYNRLTALGDSVTLGYQNAWTVDPAKTPLMNDIVGNAIENHMPYSYPSVLAGKLGMNTAPRLGLDKENVHMEVAGGMIPGNIMKYDYPRVKNTPANDWLFDQAGFYNFGLCGLMASDLHMYLTDPTYTNRGFSDFADNMILKSSPVYNKYMNRAIDNSDLVTMMIGNNDLMQNIMMYMMFGNADMEAMMSGDMSKVKTADLIGLLLGMIFEQLMMGRTLSQCLDFLGSMMPTTLPEEQANSVKAALYATVVALESGDEELIDEIVETAVEELIATETDVEATETDVEATETDVEQPADEETTEEVTEETEAATETEIPEVSEEVTEEVVEEKAEKSEKSLSNKKNAVIDMQSELLNNAAEAYSSTSDFIKDLLTTPIEDLPDIIGEPVNEPVNEPVSSALNINNPVISSLQDLMKGPGSKETNEEKVEKEVDPALSMDIEELIQKLKDLLGEVNAMKEVVMSLLESADTEQLTSMLDRFSTENMINYFNEKVKPAYIEGISQSVQDVLKEKKSKGQFNHKDFEFVMVGHYNPFSVENFLETIARRLWSGELFENLSEEGQGLMALIQAIVGTVDQLDSFSSLSFDEQAMAELDVQAILPQIKQLLTIDDKTKDQQITKLLTGMAYPLSVLVIGPTMTTLMAQVADIDREIAEKYGIHYLNLESRVNAVNNLDPHPSAIGHEFLANSIYDAVAPALTANKSNLGLGSGTITGTVVDPKNGTYNVSTGMVRVRMCSDATYTIKANEGSKIGAIYIDGIYQSQLMNPTLYKNGVIKFNDLDEGHTITVRFDIDVIGNLTAGKTPFKPYTPGNVTPITPGTTGIKLDAAHTADTFNMNGILIALSVSVAGLMGLALYGKKKELF